MSKEHGDKSGRFERWLGVVWPLWKQHRDDTKVKELRAAYFEGYEDALKDLDAPVSSIAASTEPGRIPDLELARTNADYWLGCARHSDENNLGHALIHAEQAINAWKNAAYTMADQRDQFKALSEGLQLALDRPVSAMRRTGALGMRVCEPACHSAAACLNPDNCKADMTWENKRARADQTPAHEAIDPCSALCRECKADGMCIKKNPVYRDFAKSVAP